MNIVRLNLPVDWKYVTKLTKLKTKLVLLMGAQHFFLRFFFHSPIVHFVSASYLSLFFLWFQYCDIIIFIMLQKGERKKRTVRSFFMANRFFFILYSFSVAFFLGWVFFVSIERERVIFFAFASISWKLNRSSFIHTLN